MGNEKVQIACWLSGESAALLRSLAAREGRAIGRVLESAIAAYADTSGSLVPTSDGTSTATSAPLADTLERLAMLESRMDAMEARMAVEAKETAFEPVSLAGKGRVAGTGESSPGQSGSRGNKAQKRSLHGATDDQFDQIVRQHLAGTKTLTGIALRRAGFSFPEKRLSESLKRLKV